LFFIQNLDKFPKNLKQRHKRFGCIPTSVAAVLTYRGVPSVEECTILDETLHGIIQFRDRDSLCFSTVDRYFVQPHFGDRYQRTVDPDLERFAEWKNYIALKVKQGFPVTISLNREREHHVVTVVGANPNTTIFKVHDPARGDLIDLDVSDEGLRHAGYARRNNDVLIIEPKRKHFGEEESPRPLKS